MIPVILSLVATLLYGGPDLRDSYFELPYAANSIKANVDDPFRREVAIRILNEYNIALRQKKEAQRRVLRSLKKCATSQESNVDDVARQIALFITFERQERLLWMGTRTELADVLTEEEMLAVHKNTMMNNKKVLDKNREIEEQHLELKATAFEALRASIVDEKKLRMLLQELEAFDAAIKSHIDEHIESGNDVNEILTDHLASEEELSNLNVEINIIYEEIFGAYASFRTTLAKNTTEKEWNEIQKLVRKFKF